MHPIFRSVANMVGLGRKAAVSAPISAGNIPSAYGLFISSAEITPYNAWLLYMTNSTFAKVVDMIADNVAQLVPLVQVEGKPVDGHPARLLLDRPGFNRTRRSLIKELAVQQLVTGTCYPHIYGNPRFFPLAIDSLKSQFVTPYHSLDAWPDSYGYAEMTRTIQFRRDDNPRDFRYIDEATGMSEVVPVYDISGNRRGVGLARLNAVRADVELRLKGTQHNMSMLDKGARLSGIANYKDPLSIEQREDISMQLRSLATGSSNAGSVLVTSGGEMDFTALSQNAKDMDFVKLMQTVDDAIVARYNVPVTLFRTEAQTNNNYETAWNLMYDQAVLPTFQIVYSGIANVMTQRLGYPIEIIHDALTAPVLARQASARAVQLFNAKLIARNEARQIIGYEPVLGGDTIMGPMGEVPVGEDMFTGIEQRLGKDELDTRQAERAATAKPKKPTETSEKPSESPARTRDKPARNDAAAEKAFGTLLAFTKSLDESRMNGRSVH